MKRCVGCMELLSVDEFGKHSTTYDGLISKCRECRKEYSTYHYNKWLKKNPEKRLLASARHRARTKNLPLDITLEDIVIPKVCPVLGIPFEINTGEKARYNSPSLDRFIPELGYVKGNVYVVSFRANQLKQNATIDEVERIYKWMKKTGPGDVGGR